MDREEQDKKSFINELKKPYVKITATISIIIIIAMYLTQAYWMNFGMGLTFTEYHVGDKLPTKEPFILSGYYHNGELYNGITWWNKSWNYREGGINITISEITCNNGVVKLLVINPRRNLNNDLENINLNEIRYIVNNITQITPKQELNIHVLKVFEGCNK